MPRTSPSLLLSTDRRTVLRAAGALAVSGGLAGSRESLAQTPASATPITIEPGSDWPTWQGNPARTGIGPDAGIIGEPTLLWRIDTELGASHASPVIADSVVYVTVGIMGDGFLVALDLVSGEMLWSAEAGSLPFSSTPAVVDGVIYIAGFDGTVRAVDLDTQKVLWTATLGAKTSSSPVIAGDIVAIGADDDQLYALDRADGTERWRIRVGDGAAYVSGPSPSFADGVLYYSNASEQGDRALFAIDAESGDERWVFEPDNAGLDTPAIADGVAYVGGNGGAVYAIDIESGDEIWKAEVGRVLSAPAVTEDAVIVQVVDGILVALERGSGEVRWQTPNALSRCSPVVAGDIVYLTIDGLWFEMGLYGYDLASGEERWHVRTDGTNASPAISGNVVVVADGSAVTVLGGSTGDALERGTNGEGAFISPIDFSTEIDEHNEPIDPARVLQEGAVDLYASYDCIGVWNEDLLEVTWWLDGEILITRSEPWPGTASGRYFETIHANEGALPAGAYEIEIMLAGIPVRRGAVEIR